MKITIEKTIEVFTDRTIEGFNAIVEYGKICKSFKEFDIAIQYDNRIQNQEFFIYFGGSHIAIHEILPTGEKSERLLIITY